MPGSPVWHTQAQGGSHCSLGLSALPLLPQTQHFDDRAREGGVPAQMWGLSWRPASSAAMPQFPHTFLICPSLHPMEWGLTSPFCAPRDREGAGALSPGVGRRGCMGRRPLHLRQALDTATERKQGTEVYSGRQHGG